MGEELIMHILYVCNNTSGIFLFLLLALQKLFVVDYMTGLRQKNTSRTFEVNLLICYGCTCLMAAYVSAKRK